MHFFVMSVGKLAILAGPILASLPVRVKLITTTTHNTQHTTTKISRRHPTLPETLPSLSMSRLLAPPTNGAVAPYGPTQGARGWVWWRDGWFACLGGKMKPHKKIEEYGASALGGHHLEATHNNQPIVGRRGRGYFCCKLPRYVPYKGTYVPYDGTYGASDQGQMLDV